MQKVENTGKTITILPQSSTGKANAFFQPKLTVNEPGDVYEQEADAVADKVMRMKDGDTGNNFFNLSKLNIQRKCQHCEEEEKEHVQKKEDNNTVSETASNTKNDINRPYNTSSPMPAKARNFFEARMGYDFSNVRLHTDNAADQSAKSINALAYTQANNVVFAADQYNPETDNGKRLMAHELTHVVQQTGGAPTSTIQRKNGSKPQAPAYQQEAIDLVEAAKKKIIKFQTGSQIPPELPVLEKYEAFTEAIAKNDVAAIPKLLDDFLKSGTDKFPALYPSRSNIADIVAKLFTLELGNEADRVKQFFLSHEIAFDSKTHTPAALTGYFWDSVYDKMPDAFTLTNADAAISTADAWLSVAAGVSKDLAATVADPYLSKAFIQFQAAYQVIIDKAIDDLGNGKGDKFFKIAKAKIDAMAGLVLPKDFMEKDTEITKTEFTSENKKYTSGVHKDYFMQGPKAKSHTVTIDFYDPDMRILDADEKKLPIRRIQEIRAKQIEALEQVYGFQKDDKGNLTDDTKENAAAIKKLGHMELHSDEDWRKFLLEKFMEHKKAGGDNASAFEAVIKTISTYMDAFTIRTDFNIEDEKNNQLDIAYPRALTGQLIHDCGVYALRMVYMLSLIRNQKDLNLSIKFIRLPIHAALIITGTGLPTYFTHDNKIIPYQADVIKEQHDKWEEVSKTKGFPLPAANRQQEQFLGELSASELLPGADMPFRIVDAPKLSGKKGADIANLWSFYKSDVVKDIFDKTVQDPKSKNFQLDVMYLEGSELFKKFYNESYVPLWNNTVRPKWKDKKLQDARKLYLSTAPGKDKVDAWQKFDALFDDFQDAVSPGFEKLDKDFIPVKQKTNDISKSINQHKAALESGVLLGNAERIQEMDKVLLHADDWPGLKRVLAFDIDIGKQGDARDKDALPLE